MANPVGRPRKTAPIDPDIPRADVKVIERRIANPYGEPEVIIPLKTNEPMHLRWFDGAASGRMYQALGRLGYVKVPRALVADENILSSLEDFGDGYIRRGERGTEYLCMMPKSDWDRIQKAKADARATRRRNPTAVREDLAHAVANRYGTEEPAAMVMGQHPVVNFTGSMQESTERVSLDEG